MQTQIMYSADKKKFLFTWPSCSHGYEHWSLAVLFNSCIILIVIIIAFNSASRLCTFLICSLKMWSERNLEVCVYPQELKIEIKFFLVSFDQSSFIYSVIGRCKCNIYIQEVLEIFLLKMGDWFTTKPTIDIVRYQWEKRILVHTAVFKSSIFHCF